MLLYTVACEHRQPVYVDDVRFSRMLGKAGGQAVHGEIACVCMEQLVHGDRLMRADSTVLGSGYTQSEHAHMQRHS